MNTKIRKPNLSLLKRIETDRDFRLMLAIKSGCQEVSVKRLAERHSTKLLHYDLVQFYLAEGYVESDIFE